MSEVCQKWASCFHSFTTAAEKEKFVIFSPIVKTPQVLTIKSEAVYSLQTQASHVSSICFHNPDTHMMKHFHHKVTSSKSPHNLTMNSWPFGKHQDMATFLYGLLDYIFYNTISLELKNLYNAWYTVCIIFYIFKNNMVTLACEVNTLQLK